MNEPVDASLQLHTQIRAYVSKHARAAKLRDELRKKEAELAKAEKLEAEYEKALSQVLSLGQTFICGEWAVQLKAGPTGGQSRDYVECSRVEVVAPCDPKQPPAAEK